MFSSILTALFVLGLSAPMTGMAAECSVPVCDIATEMSRLETLNSDKRGEFALNLKAQYKDVADAAALENLYTFAIEVKTLVEAKKDDDWVLRAANDFLNTMVLNLAKFSAVDGDNLVNLYRKLEGQISRYALITHWQSELKNIEDVKTLEALVVFGAGARTRSIEANDEDWVARAATALITEITIKLTNLDPAHEGLYNVAMTEASLALGTLAFDKVAVLDSSSSKNLVVVFINSKLRVTVYSFSNAEIKGNEVSGIFMSNGDISNRFSFVLDRASGSIKGSIESTKNDTIEFAGSQLFSTRTVFAGNVPRSVGTVDVLGTMKGSIAGIQGKLAVKTFMPGVYSATFTSDNGSVVLSFQGKFFPKNGVLSLTSSDKIKLVLSLREGVNGEEWMGTSFSTITGTFSKASFQTLK
jgi:hypothetical protein